MPAASRSPRKYLTVLVGISLIISARSRAYAGVTRTEEGITLMDTCLFLGSVPNVGWRT